MTLSAKCEGPLRWRFRADAAGAEYESLHWTALVINVLVCRENGSFSQFNAGVAASDRP
jgi:hypothetical protein